MRTMMSVLLLMCVAAFMISCGGPKALTVTDTGDIPEWFMNIPEDPNFLFAAKTAASMDLQMAIDKAGIDGRAEIARQVEVKVNSLQKRFMEEVGAGQDAQLLEQTTQATKTVVSTSLSGSKVSKTKTVKDGNQFRAYVLVGYPIGAANAALVDQIKKSNNLYTRFQASETFKELEEETRKFDEWKKTQAPAPTN